MKNFGLKFKQRSKSHLTTNELIKKLKETHSHKYAFPFKTALQAALSEKDKLFNKNKKYEN